jgi:hypothetical protein
MPFAAHSRTSRGCVQEQPRERALKLQQDAKITSGKSIVLPDVYIEVISTEHNETVTTTINSSVLLLILLECIRGFVRDHTDRYVQEHAFDMFKDFSALRGVCRAFYLIMLDAWPELQREFFKEFHKWLVSHDRDTDLQNEGPSRYWSMRDLLHLLDPRITRKHTLSVDHCAVAQIGTSYFHEVFMVHLRYHCVPYLIMLWWNDRVIRKKAIKDVDGIPSLCGFAAYLDQSFSDTIAAGLSECEAAMCGELDWAQRELNNLKAENPSEDDIKKFYMNLEAQIRNAVIMTFYEGGKVPVWNMLPDETGSKNLETYLHETALKRIARQKREALEARAHHTFAPQIQRLTMGEVLCAPAAVFAGEWPRSSKVGSLKHYVLNKKESEEESEDLEFPMPPVRLADFRYHSLIVEITLPMRLLLHKSTENGITTWKHTFGCYTMNITTGMLTTASRVDQLPDDFHIIDVHGVSLNPDVVGGVPNHLLPGVALDDIFFSLWAEVLLTNEANPQYRDLMNALPVFRNFVMVEESIIHILHRSLCLDDYVNDDAWDDEGGPIHDDWGKTTMRDLGNGNFCVDLDQEFIYQFISSNMITKDHVELPRYQWASSTYFLLDSRRAARTQKDLGRNFMFDAYVRPNTVSLFTRHAHKHARPDWSRHIFPACEMVVNALNLTLRQSMAKGKKRVTMVNMGGDISQLFNRPAKVPRPVAAASTSTNRKQKTTYLTDGGSLADLFSR